MPLTPAVIPEILICAPLDPPMQVRARYAQWKRDESDWDQHPDGCGQCTGYLPRRDRPNAPTPAGYTMTRLHEAVDLDADAGDCVFSAYSGRVVEATSLAGGTKGNVTIDHNETGMGLVSRYLHLEGASICVDPGDFVTKGKVIAHVSAEPHDPHLHFELRAVVNRPGEEAESDDAASGDEYWNDNSTVPVDPTRLLYRWEDHHMTVPGASVSGTSVVAVGAERIDDFPMFRLMTGDGETYAIPMYEPMTEHERALIVLARDAHARGLTVDIDYRQSTFFGNHDIVTGMRVT